MLQLSRSPGPCQPMVCTSRVVQHIPRGSNQRLSKVVQNVKKCQTNQKDNKNQENVVQYLSKSVPISLYVVLWYLVSTTLDDSKPSGHASHASHASHDHFSPLWSEGHGSRLDSRLAKSNVGQVEAFQPGDSKAVGEWTRLSPIKFTMRGWPTTNKPNRTSHVELVSQCPAPFFSVDWRTWRPGWGKKVFSKRRKATPFQGRFQKMIKEHKNWFSWQRTELAEPDFVITSDDSSWFMVIHHKI